MKKHIALWAIMTMALGLFQSSLAANFQLGNTVPTSVTLSPSFPQFVNAFIRQVTVRLIDDYVAGSGTLFARQGNTYFVLTCAHVIDGSPSTQTLKVLTSDGRSYKASREQRIHVGNLDLAVVNFTSPHHYPLASWEHQTHLSLRSFVYISGFPNLRYSYGDWHNTFDLGIEPYQMNRGWVSLLLRKPLERGYQLGLSSDVVQGMSGGPVFNESLELIGIIGRSKYGIGGLNAYRFADGSYPSQREFTQMESLSWAIPVQRFSQLSHAF